MKSISDRLTELRKLNGIDLQSPGEPLRLRITVGDPALSSEIDFVTRRGHVPDEVVDMWRVSRETRLFEDVDYGQWGLVLLSPKAALERTAWERKIRPDELLMNDFVIGEFLGDLEFLMISDVESRGTVLTVSSPYEKRSTWCIVGESLSQFIEEYFDARGDKFWERI